MINCDLCEFIRDNEDIKEIIKSEKIELNYVKILRSMKSA